MQSKHSWVRRSTRVFRMVSELHRLGYQKARIMPHIHPLAYRIVIAPDAWFSEENGAYSARAYEPPAIAYSSASKNNYFDWSDSGADDARSLAEKFVKRFPDLATLCEGSDWCYAGWLSDLLAALEREPDRLPFVLEEYMEEAPESLREIPLKCASSGKTLASFPLPPSPAGRTHDISTVLS